LLSLGLLQEFQIPVTVAGPQEVAEAIQKECATSESFTLRVDGFVGMLVRLDFISIFGALKTALLLCQG
jgi:hypothetical protein